MRYREIAKKLRKLGCVELPRKGTGSHRKWHNPSVDKIVVIPDWTHKDLKIGTVQNAVKQLGFDWDEFNNA